LPLTALPASTVETPSATAFNAEVTEFTEKGGREKRPTPNPFSASFAPSALKKVKHHPPKVLHLRLNSIAEKPQTTAFNAEDAEIAENGGRREKTKPKSVLCALCVERSYRPTTLYKLTQNKKLFEKLGIYG